MFEPGWLAQQEWIIDLSDSTPTAPAPAPVSSIAVLSDLLKANGIAPADLLELSEGSLTELIDTAPLASRAAIGREIKAIKEVRTTLWTPGPLYTLPVHVPA